MLETDCKIPTEFVPIELPETYPLYGVDHAVKVMREQGAKKWQICKKLRIGDDAWRDAIFEIRKQEAIEDMARGKKLTDDQIKRIKMLRQAGATQTEIAADIGCTQSAVHRYLSADKMVETAQEAAECTQSASVQTLAKVTGDAQKPAESAQSVPDAVLDAILVAIDAQLMGIDERLTQIRRMQQEIEEARSKVAELKAWLEVNGYDGDSAE